MSFVCVLWARWFGSSQPKWVAPTSPVRPLSQASVSQPPCGPASTHPGATLSTSFPTVRSPLPPPPCCHAINQFPYSASPPFSHPHAATQSNQLVTAAWPVKRELYTLWKERGGCLKWETCVRAGVCMQTLSALLARTRATSHAWLAWKPAVSEPMASHTHCPPLWEVPTSVCTAQYYLSSTSCYTMTSLSSPAQ